MKKLLVILVVVVLIVSVSYSKSDDHEEDVRDFAYKLVNSLPAYKSDPSFWDKTTETAHLQAFNESFKTSGDSRSTEDNKKLYVQIFLDRMLAECATHKKDDMTEQLGVIRDFLLSEGKFKDGIPSSSLESDLSE